MRYFYVLHLMDAKKDTSSEIKEYINIHGFACMDDIQIRQLSIKLGLSFKETLRDVFTYFLQIEHHVISLGCKT